tara:strand:- start:32 stop:262 length:231 start_codon:yes stop_codon:yes gene_type:complete
MIKIPYEELEQDTLRALIEEFVTREGTDYGHSEVSLETKVKDVLEQLIGRRAFVTFDPESETATIVTKEVAVQSRI